MYFYSCQANTKKGLDMNKPTYKPIWNVKITDENGNECGWAADGETAKEALEQIIKCLETWGAQHNEVKPRN